MNYDKKMKEQINGLDDNNKLLLHVCCAPCSSATLERLGNKFDIDILYFNPNISDEEEYNKRLNELKRFISEYNENIKVIDGRYEPLEFFKLVKGLEKEKERGKRCYECYNYRLEETAKVASKLGYDYFATSLTLSPYKNSDWINEIGSKLDSKYKATYLYSDFKKENGYKRSIELSKEFNLYRQDYCGCIFSKIEREEYKKEKGDI